VVAAFGNFRDKKGTDHLIWACAELADELDLTLLLVGDFVAKEKPHWERLVEESGIGDRLIVTGRLPREQALAYHNLVDIFVIPSIRDGCPNALLEAMLARKAILATGVDAIGEILSHEEDAVLIETASAEELAAGIRRLGEDRELRARLGEAARRKVRTRLAPEVELKNWLKVYESVTAGGIRPSAAGALG
jgi:glycosyltransferase involved in cell wall biosynthesis